MDSSAAHEQNRINVSKSNLEAGGDIIIDGKKVINIYQVADYESVAIEIQEKEKAYAYSDKMLAFLRQGEGDAALEAEVKDTLTALKKELKVLRARELGMRKEILRLAETFSEIEINTDRLKKAKELFDRGQLKEANRMLNKDELEHEQDLLLQDRQMLLNRLRALEEKLKENARAYLLKAQFTATDFDHPHRIEEIVDCFEHSLQSVRAFRNLFKLACFLQDHGQLGAAEQYFQEALAAPDATPGEKADALYYIGMIYHDRGVFSQALEYYNNSMAMLEEAPEKTTASRRALAARHIAAGSLYQDFGDYSAAAGHLDKALALLSQVKEKGGPRMLEAQADLYNNYGALNEAQEQWDDALLHYQEALKLYRELNESAEGEYADKKAFLLSNLGALYQEMEKNNDALDSYQQAFEIYHQLANKNPEKYNHHLGLVHINLGIYYHSARPEREQSIGHTTKGISYIEPFLEEMPALQDYVDTGRAVLRSWGN